MIALLLHKPMSHHESRLQSHEQWLIYIKGCRKGPPLAIRRPMQWKDSPSKLLVGWTTIKTLVSMDPFTATSPGLSSLSIHPVCHT